MPGSHTWRFSPVWLVLISIVSVQFGSSLGKSLFDETGPAAMAWLRMAIAFPLLMLLARPRLRGRTKAAWGCVVLYGLTLGTMNFAIYQSFARIPIGLAVTIEFLGPLAVAFTGIRRARDLTWIALACVGVVLLGWSPILLDWVGIAWALLAAATWAGYIVVSVPVGRNWENISGVAVGSGIGMVLFAVPGIIGGGQTMWQPHILGIAVGVAVASSIVPYAFEMIALRQIKPSVFGILMSLEPAVAAVTALIMLGERLTLIELAAMACVIIASIGATRTMGYQPGPEGLQPSESDDPQLPEEPVDR